MLTRETLTETYPASDPPPASTLPASTLPASTLPVPASRPAISHTIRVACTCGDGHFRLARHTGVSAQDYQRHCAACGRTWHIRVQLIEDSLPDTIVEHVTYEADLTAGDVVAALGQFWGDVGRGAE